MTFIGVTSTAYQVEKRSWLLSAHGTDPGTTPSITLDVSAFTAGIHYPDGYIPSGTPVGVLASGLYGPYTVTDEVQTLTEGGSGLTSFTITYSGQTTASIDDDATAAEVQAALEALSNIAPGDVTVTGGPLATGPFTVTFGGTLADTNVAAMTTTPTGGTGTVDVATTTAGGTEGTAGTASGLLFSSVKVPDINDTTKDVGAAMVVHGFVKLSKLPFTLDANGRTDLKLIHFVA
jgi:hypothetical protein